jgi:hypothetical protein
MKLFGLIWSGEYFIDAPAEEDDDEWGAIPAFLRRSRLK